MAMHLPMLKPDFAYWWFHPPKTGSSFRNTLLELPWSRDRDRTWPHGNHQVLFPDIAGRMTTPNVRVVAMFRQPESRLLSSYFHMRDWVKVPQRRKGYSGYRQPLGGTVGCCWEDWGWPASEYRPVHQNVINGVPPEQSGINRFHGCQTNMVLGKGCMSRFANTPAQVAQAIALVDKFEFVGDQKYWNLSICLFNTIVTGRRHTLSYQLTNTRPTTSKRLKLRRATPANTQLTPSEQAAAAHQEAALSRLNTTDPIDGALYAYASYRFSHDLRRYGVSDECCPNFDRVEQIPPQSSEPARCALPRQPPTVPSSAAATRAHMSAWRGARSAGKTLRSPAARQRRVGVQSG